MGEIKILKRVMQANDTVADKVRERAKAHNVLIVNMMSSPGSGKTTIIEKTIEAMKDSYNFAVIEGDIATTLDAERLQKFDIPLVQISTSNFGGECHLEASWILDSVNDIDLDKTDIVIIENVGNLVCPAEFDTGAELNVLVLSITEGEDKPLKYPLAFRKSQVMLINKMDLAEYLDISIEKIRQNAKQVNPELNAIEISAKKGDNFEEWINWLKNKAK